MICWLSNSTISSTVGQVVGVAVGSRVTADTDGVMGGPLSLHGGNLKQGVLDRYKSGKRGNFSFLLSMPQLGVMSLGFENRHEYNLLQYLLDVYLFKSLNETNLYQNFTYKTSYSYMFEEAVYDSLTLNHLRFWDGAIYKHSRFYSSSNRRFNN